MALSDVTTYYVRKWLNRPRHGSHAHVLAEVRITPASEFDKRHAYASFELSDCTRTVMLSFHLEGGRYDANSLYKARLLRKTVEEFVEAVEEAHEELKQ